MQNYEKRWKRDCSIDNIIYFHMEYFEFNFLYIYSSENFDFVTIWWVRE